MKSYEQKYKAALEWMQGLYDGLHGATKEDAEHYFPELKENKSERVRKGLIKTVSSLLDNTILYHTDITKEEALAWLEKQGETFNTDITNRSDEMLHAISTGLTDVGVELGWSDFGGIPIEEIKDWLEKQGEKSTTINIDKMVMEYSQTKDGDFGLPVNCMIRAYRKGINDALSITLFKNDFRL